MIMDFYIFIGTQIILNYSIKKRRLILGSILASGFYCLSYVVPVLSQMPFYLYYFFIPIIPILIIFKPTSLKAFIKILILNHFVAFLIGGAVFNSYYIGLTLGIIKSNSIMLPILVGGVICLIVYLSAHFIRKCFIMPHFEYHLHLSRNGRSMDLRGFLDSGNSLYTVFSHKPVSVVSYEDIKGLLSENEKNVMQECFQYGIQQSLNKIYQYMPKVYLIPYESIGCTEGVLLGIVIEKMAISKGQYSQIFEECVVGIAPNQVFHHQAYNVLIHPDYLVRV